MNDTVDESRDVKGFHNFRNGMTHLCGSTTLPITNSDNSCHFAMCSLASIHTDSPEHSTTDIGMGIFILSKHGGTTYH